MIDARRGHEIVKFRRYSCTTGMKKSSMPLNESETPRASYMRSTRAENDICPRLAVERFFEERVTLVAGFALLYLTFLVTVFLGGSGGGSLLPLDGPGAAGA